MMLYLTGATSPAFKSGDAPQTDVSKSLGGYVSSSPVPNASINSLFDLVSMQTIKDKQKETIALALVNRLDTEVRDVTIGLLTNPDNVCKFRVAAVKLGESFQMEHIPNRYSEPIQANFFDVNFYKPSVEVEIKKFGNAGDVLFFDPFDVEVVVEGSGIDATWQAIKKAFSASEKYSIRRITENSFKIESVLENSVKSPVSCSCLCHGEVEVEFLGDFVSLVDNTSQLTETLAPNEAIGIWLQREVCDEVDKTDEQLVDEYDSKRVLDTTEEVSLVINYNLP